MALPLLPRELCLGVWSYTAALLTEGPTVASSTLYLKTLFDYDACTYWVLITDLVRVWWATGDRALLEREHRRLNANMMPADAILRNLAAWLTRPTGVERAAQVDVGGTAITLRCAADVGSVDMHFRIVREVRAQPYGNARAQAQLLRDHMIMPLLEMSRPIHPDYVPSSYDPLPGADSPEIAALPLQSSSSSSKPPPPKAGNAAWISTASLFDFSDDVLESLSIAAAGGSDAAHSSASAASAASAAHQHVLPRLSPAAASSSSASSSSFSSFAIPAAPSANRSARPAAVAMGAFDAEAGASQSVLFAVPTHSQRSKQMQQLQMQQQRQQFPLQNAPAARPGANAHISTFDSYVQNESQMCASAAVLPSLHASQWASSSSSASAYDSAAAFAASELAPQVSHEDRYRAAMLAVIRRNEALSDDELALNSFESAQQRAARLAPIVLAPSQPPAAQPENQPHEPHSLASFEVPLASRKRGADQINRAEDGIASSSSSSSSSSVSSIPPLERGSDSSNNNVPAAAESIPAPAPLAAPAMIRESDEDAKAAERLRLLEVELEQKRAAAKKKKAKSFV